jgi:hypothetical protein
MKRFIPFALSIIFFSASPAWSLFGRGEEQKSVTATLNVLQDAPDIFRILSGSTIDVVLDTQLSTATATVGDAVSGHLEQPLEYAGAILIPAGTTVLGRVSAVDSPKRQLKADVSTHHWLNSQAGIDIDFYEMKSPHGSILPIRAMPAANSVVVSAPSATMKLRVDKDGDVTPDFHQGADTALGLAIDGAAIATGPFGLLLAPAAGAVAGAMHPSYGLDRPTTDDDAHPRWHGMLMGALGGVPGGFLAKDAIDKGADVVLSPGDKLLVQLTNDVSVRK